VDELQQQNMTNPRGCGAARQHTTRGAECSQRVRCEMIWSGKEPKTAVCYIRMLFVCFTYLAAWRETSADCANAAPRSDCFPIFFDISKTSSMILQKGGKQGGEFASQSVSQCILTNTCFLYPAAASLLAGPDKLERHEGSA
jgi:hypothetical protein